MSGYAADVTVADQRERFRAWLDRRTASQTVQLVETHVSILGLSADRVWKLKKAVRFPFLDLSTAALRRLDAEREFELNRRFAPDVYLGVVALDSEGATGPDAGEPDAGEPDAGEPDAGEPNAGEPNAGEPSAGEPSAGEPSAGEPSAGEVVVEMRRMPDDRRLSVVAATPAAPDCIDRIADALVAMHRRSPTGPTIDRAGSPQAVLDLWDRNLDELRVFAPSMLDDEALDAIADAVHRYVAGRGSLFAQRIADGRIRDGHGDLLADDVFCLDDGPRILDCLEFDEQLRFGDVLADVGFLAMDLERLGHPELADRLLDRYRRGSGDSWPGSLADLYLAYRASVRAKVAGLGVADTGAPGIGTARQLLALAAAHLERGRVRLVLVGGPPASGKTTLARELARRTGWDALHSDEVRKELAGLSPTTSAAADLDAGLYTPAWNARVYDAMLRRAAPLLSGGRSVILDASWSDPAHRADASRIAETTSSALSAFALSTPAEVADARARARAATHLDASDASTAVTAPLRTRFVDWPDATQLRGTEGAPVLADSVLDRLGYRDPVLPPAARSVRLES